MKIMKINIKAIVPAIILSTLALSSCVKDLNTEPLDPTITTLDKLFSSDSSASVYDGMLAKCYACLNISGQGSQYLLPDVANPDQGVATFMRGYWNAEEQATDESFNVWGDADLSEYHNFNWSDANSYITTMYNRVFFNISVCNEFLRNVLPRIGGESAAEQVKLKQYVAEARFLRALYYYSAMDLWGNVPFATDKDLVGAFLPPQIKRADLFAYIESELKDINSSLLPANQDAANYGRANKAASWALLAKIYLNSEVYLGIGNSKYTECIAYCDSIMNAGYTLHPVYAELFLADNNVTCRDEIIFPVVEDGTYSQNYGTDTYIINAEVGGSMNRASFGIPSNGWAGNITTTTFIHKFPDVSGATDKRAMFYLQSYAPGIPLNPTPSTKTFSDTLAITKFKNVTSKGAQGSNALFVDTDFPFFRLAETYLTYAEAILRGGTGGTRADALDKINLLRARAGAAPITDGELTLNFILDERARELYWECQRRTDLIRFGMLVNAGYTWDWKGGEINGKVITGNYLNLYPLPASDLGVNINLVQNPGY